MPVVHSRYEQLLAEVQRMIKRDEADAYKKLGSNMQLFNSRIAHGGYANILQDSSKSALEKLQDIYLVARTLSMRQKFNSSTKLHQKISDLTRCVYEEVQHKLKR